MEAVETATTTSAASVKIETVSVAPESITFRLVPMNAVSVSYAVAGPEEDVETMELPNRSEGGEQQEFTEDGLSEDTNYTIVATATNASGEESKRAYKTVRIDIEPTVEITSVEPESDQARVSVKIANAVQYAWSCVESGSETPARDAFSKVAATDVNSFIISSLEESTEYTVYVYGITKSGYEGKIISEDFVTAEYVEKPFEITVSNVTSTDADVAVTFDKDLYSSYYLVIGPAQDMSDISEYDFEAEYGGYASIRPEKYEEDMSISFTEFMENTIFSLETMYNIGGVPIMADGTVDKDATVWRQAQLEPVVFGESGLSLEIRDVSVQMDNASFGLNINNAGDMDKVYIGVKQNKGDIEDIAKDMICYPRSFITDAGFFDKDTTFSYLFPETDYVIIAVAKDRDGKLSQIASHEVQTKSVMDQGDATCSISEPVVGTNDIVFDVAMDPGTVGVLYRSQEKDEWYDEATFVKSLKINNFNKISEDGEVKLGNLNSETDYIVGFCAVGEDGTLGKHYLIDVTTEPYVFDGNPDAVVTIEIESVTMGDWSNSVKFTATPNDKVSKYYFGISDANNRSYFTESSFVDQCMQGSKTEYTGIQTFEGWDGSGESCGSEAVIWILAVDMEGKLVPVAETKVEDTW